VKKLLASVAIAATLLAAACGSAPTRQQKADAAAKQVSGYTEQVEQGHPISSAQASAFQKSVESSTGCTLVGVTGGPVPTDPAEHQAFVSNIQKGVASYLKSHPGYVVGLYIGSNHGGLVELDCNAQSTSSPAAA
jgi:ABC-type phosphate/phosphonate transport system substrate-binding protein